MITIKTLSNFFSCQHMLSSGAPVPDCPPSKQVYKTTLNLAWPSVIERLLVSFVSALDTIMVGVLGASAIAAVGLTQQPTFILLAVIFSLNIGVTAIVARRFGEENYENANTILRQSIVLITALSVILSCIFYVFAEPILAWMGAEPDVLPLSIDYFKIVLIGMPFNALSLNMNAAQRGAGNTKIAMRANISANLVNLTINFLLINGNFGFPALGVKGAAIGTLLGYMVAFSIALHGLLRSTSKLQLDLKSSWKLDKETISSILGISSSAMVEQLCMRLGFLMYVKMITNLGTIAYATHQACTSILNMTFSLGDGLSMAASSFVGRNLGAKRPDLSIIYGKTCQRIGLILSSILVVIYLVFRKDLIGLFSDEPQIIALGSVIMLIVAIVTPLQTSQVIMSGSLRGAGDTKFVARTSFISILLIRPVITFVFCYTFNLGLLGAWLALLLDQIIRLLFNFVRFSSGDWTKIKV